MNTVVSLSSGLYKIFDLLEPFAEAAGAIANLIKIFA